MISKHEMMDLIVDVAPGFGPILREFKEEWEPEGVDMPYYLVICDLVRYMAVLETENDVSTLNKIFQVVEQWHIEGDKYVREAASIGMLEDLQNTNIVGPDGPDKFYTYLGPVSKRWWKKVERFWSHGELIPEELKPAWIDWLYKKKKLKKNTEE